MPCSFHFWCHFTSVIQVSRTIFPTFSFHSRTLKYPNRVHTFLYVLFINTLHFYVTVHEEQEFISPCMDKSITSRHWGLNQVLDELAQELHDEATPDHEGDMFNRLI